MKKKTAPIIALMAIMFLNSPEPANGSNPITGQSQKTPLTSFLNNLKGYFAQFDNDEGPDGECDCGVWGVLRPSPLDPCGTGRTEVVLIGPYNKIVTFDVYTWNAPVPFSHTFKSKPNYIYDLVLAGYPNLTKFCLENNVYYWDIDINIQCCDKPVKSYSGPFLFFYWTLPAFFNSSNCTTGSGCNSM